MSGNDERLLDTTIRRAVRAMPDEEPPAGFSARVMTDLKPKKMSLMTRFSLWLTGPKSLTFTPMQAIPVAACAVLLLVFGVFSMQPGSVPGNDIRLSTVRFVLNDTARNARTVSVIGSFNEWNADQSVMLYDEKSGTWTLEATLPPGDHEYVFLVDGEKLVPDPKAAMTRDDGFGNKNSILFVNGEHEQAL